MLLTVLTLGGTLLGATTIAGLLMVYQVRQGTDLSQSAKSIFAADAGIEWSIYNVVCDTVGPVNGKPCPISDAPPTFTNGASVAVTCRDDTGAEIHGADGAANCNSSSTVSVRSLGRFGNTARAFCIFEDCNGTTSTP